MLDIIKEGIKLNQSLALLPFKALRQLVDDKNTSAKQMVDVAEDVVSMPFVAASKALENSCRSCSAEAGKSQETCGGPTIRNIMVNPGVTVFSDVLIKPGERRALINVTGLLCGGWVSRVKVTLEGFAQVDTVQFISARDQFEVTYMSDEPMGEEFKESIRELIIFPGVRKFLGGVGDRLNNSNQDSP